MRRAKSIGVDVRCEVRRPLTRPLTLALALTLALTRPLTLILTLTLTLTLTLAQALTQALTLTLTLRSRCSLERQEPKSISVMRVDPSRKASSTSCSKMFWGLMSACHTPKRQEG